MKKHLAEYEEFNSEILHVFYIFTHYSPVWNFNSGHFVNAELLSFFDMNHFLMKQNISTLNQTLPNPSVRGSER